MPKHIIIHGDLVIFNPAFQGATVLVLPGKMEGSGISKITKKAICVEGDEKKVELDGMYFTPSHPIPGKGKVKIMALAPDQLAKKYKCGGKAVILKGGDFEAVLEVSSQAKQPAPPGPPVPDPTPQYMGKGKFISKNFKHTGA
ncbi:MAG: hypothetical protein H6581_04725 [Bacteroidia bacterium]|nr:hypothetical protein [Bacteroidia bacterium]